MPAGASGLKTSLSATILAVTTRAWRHICRSAAPVTGRPASADASSAIATSLRRREGESLVRPTVSLNQPNDGNRMLHRFPAPFPVPPKKKEKNANRDWARRIRSTAMFSFWRLGLPARQQITSGRVAISRSKRKRCDRSRSNSRLAGF